MNEKRNFDYKRLHPFKWCILENFPFLEDSIDVLTNYQLFCKLFEMYNKEIDSLNTLGIQVEGITDWFDNLDVQEEINNKLDEMAESGQLEEIISAYLNSTAIFGFDNVESMKQATNLINGSYAKTLGYYDINDGGSALYKIRTITNEDVVDNATIIPLTNLNLIAELITIDKLNPIQFGCYGDGIHDDTTNLQKIITYCETNKIKLISQGNKKYKISSTLNVDTLLANLSNATITSDNNINLITINSTNYYGQLEQIKFDCTNANSGIYIENGRKKTFKDLIFENISHYGFYYHNGYEIFLKDSHFKANGTANTVGIYANSSDSKFENIIMIDCQTAIVNRGLNFYNFIHAWILSNSIVENSIFADLIGNRSYYNQCYSDTYGITFKCHSSNATFVANQLEVFLNDSIWLSTMGNPYVVYFVDSGSKSVFNQITNSRLNGVRANQKILLSNEDISMIQLSNNNKIWIDKYVGIKGSLTGLSSNITDVYTNELSWDNGIVTLDFVAKVTVNPNDTRNISSAILPDYFQPESPVNTNCINSSDRWQVGQNSYLYISTNVQATLNYVESATIRYVKIHEVYKSKQFANI